MSDIEEAIEGIQRLIDSSVTRGVSQYFVAGLETAKSILTGEVYVLPDRWQDEGQPKLF